MVFRVLPNTRGRRTRAAIELIPEERIADDRDTFISWQNRRKATNPIVNGVEIDASTGRPVAYWVKPLNVEESFAGSVQDPVRIPSDQCHYAFFRRRIGQNRGYSLMHAVIHYLWKLGYYLDNELIASQIKSCFAAIIRPDENEDPADFQDGDPDGPVVDVHNNPLDKIQPGIIARLREPGDITGVGPNVPGSDSISWIRLIERGISVGMNLSYEEMMRDYSTGNFSSTRAASNADRKRYRRMQDFVVHHFCEPVYEHWVRWSVMAGLEGFPSREEFASQPDEYLAVNWRTPGWVSVNPKDDAIAQELRLANNTITREQIISAEGGDWEESFEQQSREQKRLVDLDLVQDPEDLDPRLLSEPGDQE